jgi:hypothetical protein
LVDLAGVLSIFGGMKISTIDDILQIFSSPPVRDKSNHHTLAELLGLERDSRGVIVNADDLGICVGTNRAVVDLLQQNIIDSVSLIAGAKEYDDAVKRLKAVNHSTGIHLSLTSEWSEDIISPVTDREKIPSLIESGGDFYDDIRSLYDNFDIEEVEIECRAQIEKILNSGLEIDHLDTHMGVMQLHPELLEIYMKLAHEFKLPLRLGSRKLAQLMNLPERMLDHALELGLIFPDNLIYIPMSVTNSKSERFDYYSFALENLPPGITEMYFHPTFESPDFRNLSHRYSEKKAIDYEQIRVWDYEFMTSDRFRNILENNNISRISYCDLRALS